VRQKKGIEFAEIIEVKPNTVGQGVAAAASARFQIGDDGQIQGVYGLEEGKWRWTKRNFRIWLAGGSRLALDFYLPVANNTTLSVRVGDHSLCSQTFRQPGSYTMLCDVRSEWLDPGGQWFDFSVDKTAPVQAPDTRELGLVVIGASLGR
jgi:hypothetical protein